MHTVLSKEQLKTIQKEWLGIDENSGNSKHVVIQYQTISVLLLVRKMILLVYFIEK